MKSSFSSAADADAAAAARCCFLFSLNAISWSSQYIRFSSSSTFIHSFTHSPLNVSDDYNNFFLWYLLNNICLKLRNYTFYKLFKESCISIHLNNSFFLLLSLQAIIFADDHGEDEEEFCVWQHTSDVKSFHWPNRIEPRRDSQR